MVNTLDQSNSLFQPLHFISLLLLCYNDGTSQLLQMINFTLITSSNLFSGCLRSYFSNCSFRPKYSIIMIICFDASVLNHLLIHHLEESIKALLLLRHFQHVVL